MKLMLTTWFKTWCSKKPACRRRVWRRWTGPHSIAVESLECRCVPSITSLLNSGVLSVVSNGGDPIVLGTDAAGHVTLNDADLQTHSGATVSADSVTSLNVTGSPSDDTIDLSGITLAAFASLIQLSVNGEAGDDLIVTSSFANSLTGQASPGSIISNPSRLAAGVASADINQGFELFVAGSGSASTGSVSSSGAGSISGRGTSNGGPFGSAGSNDPPDGGFRGMSEEHSASHFLWQKDATSVRPSTTAINLGLSNVADNSLLASVNGQSVPVLSRNEASLLTSTNSNSKAPESNHTNGLIDISAEHPANLGERPKSELSIPKTVDQPDENTLIATRIAVPNRSLRLRSLDSARDVPAIFQESGNGGFIELAAVAATQIPVKHNGLRSATSLSRHDQVDAEIGRFVAFGDSEFVDQLLAATSPTKVATAETVEEPATDATSSLRRMSWGLALTAGAAAAILLPPRFNRRIAGFMKSRLQKTKRGFQEMLGQRPLRRS